MPVREGLISTFEHISGIWFNNTSTMVGKE